MQTHRNSITFRLATQQAFVGVLSKSVLQLENIPWWGKNILKGGGANERWGGKNKYNKINNNSENSWPHLSYEHAANPDEGWFMFRYSFICQGTSTRRQRSDISVFEVI